MSPSCRRPQPGHRGREVRPEEVPCDELATNERQPRSSERRWGRAGRALSVAPLDQGLTTQEAADLVGISRPTLVRLLEQREISYERPAPGSRHRRVRLDDLLDQHLLLNRLDGAEPHYRHPASPGGRDPVWAMTTKMLLDRASRSHSPTNEARSKALSRPRPLFRWWLVRDGRAATAGGRASRGPRLGAR